MIDDVDVLEGQEQEVQSESQVTPQEPVSEPAPTRDDLFNEALNEGVEESVLNDLAAKEELTISDLRQIPGSEELTDEELMAQWKEIEAQEAGSGEEEEVEAYKLPFPIYDAEGNKVDALEKINLRDLLDGKLQVGYSALGKEQRKTLSETLRNASLGHFNEQKYNTALTERNQIFERYQAADKQLKQYTEERKVWDAALTALAMGNIKPMEQIAKAYQAALMQQPQVPQAGMVPISQVQEEQEQIARGIEYINGTIIPKGYEIAQQYGANPTEVVNAIKWYLEQEPAEFLTREKIESIINYEIPSLLERNGYNASGQVQVNTNTQQTSNNEVEELKKQVAALQSTIAQTSNKRTEQVRSKQTKIPPAGGGATPSAGDSVPSFKNRNQMKAYMQGDPDWSKA